MTQSEPMRNTDTIVELLADDGATLVLEYGSSVRNPDTANDVDLFAIYESDSDRRENVRLGQFEVIRLTKDELRTYRHVLNPVHCTEPVLKGEVRHGSESTFQDLRSDLERREPTPDAVRHNLRRSYTEYCKAQKFFDQGNLEKTCLTLPFAASYRLFAEWYVGGNTPETLATVRDQVDTELPTDKIFGLCDRVKNGEPVTERGLRTVFRSWESAVL